MSLAERRRDDEVDHLPPDDFILSVAERSFSRRIELGDHSAVVAGNDAVDRQIDDGRPEDFTLAVRLDRATSLEEFSKLISDSFRRIEQGRVRRHGVLTEELDDAKKCV